ncbi:MAG: hypothetical protein MR319_10055 [Mediterranea sp.]|nr:hypothetical protein [Mediterranea sp.]
MMTGQIEASVVTAKEFMLTPNLTSFVAAKHLLDTYFDSLKGC